MKLTDISKVNSDVLNTRLEAQTGWKLQLESMDTKKAIVMLESVNSKLNAIRASSQIHSSERDPRYTTMLMTQQILESYLSEAKKGSQKQARDTSDDEDDKRNSLRPGIDHTPKKKMSETKKASNSKPDFLDLDKDGNKTEPMKKAAADKKSAGEGKLGEGYAKKSKNSKYESQHRKVSEAKKNPYAIGMATAEKMTGDTPPLKKSTIKKAHKIADKIKNESKFATESKIVDLYIRKLINEDQVTQAQSVMASKDMVDSIQDMLEDLSKMLNEQLPPLVDNIRSNIGEQQATEFQQSASSSLNTLLQSAQSAREQINNAVLSLTGEGPSPMSMPDELPPNDAMSGEEDEFSTSDAAAGGNLPMGREKRA